MAASSPGSELGTQPQETLARTRHAGGIDDTFFRHIVSGMRNGVLAITSDGRLALINDEAYRVFGIEPQPGDLGQPVTSVLKAHPDVVRVLTGVFDLHHLPNRVEMRLKPQNKVIGYTLALVRNDEGAVVGAAILAAWRPARLASRINPLTVLRD